MYRLRIAPDVLVLLNDSVWFPAVQGEDYLSRMEAHTADFLGGYEMKRRPLNNYKILLPSYFLMFKKPAINSGTFKRFWSSYVQSSSVISTVQRGEHGLSRAMFQGGFECAGLLKKEDVKRTVNNFSDKDVELAVRYVNQDISDISRVSRKYSDAIRKDRRWLPKARRLLSKAARRTCTTGMPVVAINSFGFPFVKKKASAFSKIHEIILYAHTNGDLENLDKVMVEEMRRSLGIEQNK